MVAFVASLMILFMNSGVIADPALMLTAAVLFTVVAGAALRPRQRPDHDGRQDRALYRDARYDGHLSRPDDMAVAGRRDHAARAGTSGSSIVRPISARSSACRCRSWSSLRSRRLRPSSSTARATAAMSSLSARTAMSPAIPASRSIASAPSPSSSRGFASRSPCCSMCRASARPRRRRASSGNCRRSPPSSSAVRRSKVARARVWGTICGAFILELVGNIMLLSNFISEYLIGAIQGAIIIIAMLVQRSLVRKS